MTVYSVDIKRYLPPGRTDEESQKQSKRSNDAEGKILLRDQRCKTAKQMKAYVRDYVGLHLLGSPGYKSIEELVENSRG